MTTTQNRIAGTGAYSHSVPTAPGAVILMRDGGHAGTEVYRVGDDDEHPEYRFVSLDLGTVETSLRCVLVRLSGVEVEDLRGPFGCNLDTSDGLALLGCDYDDEVPGEILWDSDHDE